MDTTGTCAGEGIDPGAIILSTPDLARLRQLHHLVHAASHHHAAARDDDGVPRGGQQLRGLRERCGPAGRALDGPRRGDGGGEVAVEHVAGDVELRGAALQHRVVETSGHRGEA